jgi:hypothetical protein
LVGTEEYDYVHRLIYMLVRCVYYFLSGDWYFW